MGKTDDRVMGQEQMGLVRFGHARVTNCYIGLC